MCGFVHVVCRAWIATRFYYFIFFLLRFCDVLYFLECCGLRQWIGKRFCGLFSCVWHVRLMSTTDANFVVLGSCTACPTCSSGQYRSGCSGTNSSGSCASCTNTLQSGQYYTGSGGTNQSGCGVADCDPIGNDKYYTDNGTSAGTSATCGSAACTNAAAGEYYSSSSTTGATGCGVGEESSRSVEDAAAFLADAT